MGAGQVGSTLAESLVSEQNDITVVDIDPSRLKELQDRLDLRTVLGYAAHPSTLVEAGVEDTDLLIAVTQSDETNLAACKVGKMLFNVPTRIARVLWNDPGTGVMRHADAGYEEAIACAKEQKLDLPSL